MRIKVHVYGVALVACVVVSSCAEKQSPSVETAAESRVVAQSAAGDVRIVIAGLQEVLEPAGKPLTEKQIADIDASFDPAHPRESMKAVMGQLTSGQKTIMVNNINGQLKKTGQHLSADQKKQYMEYGPKSTIEWDEILTSGQKRALMNELGKK